MHLRVQNSAMKGTYNLIDWLWNRMAFLLRKKVKFSVDLQVCALSDVPLVNAILFAKVRLLEGGAFEDHTERAEVVNHSASWSHRSSFTCRIASDPSTGMLEKCLCRVSIRKEQKGGKSNQKMGYVDINLSEFAASGVEGMSRSYLLDGYGLNSRQDNSKVLVKITMCHQSADPFFRVPQIACYEEKTFNPIERKAPPLPLVCDLDADADEEQPVQIRKDVAETPESSSTVGSTGVAEDTASLVSETKRPTSSVVTNLRRFSQDRTSAPRVQSTRIDPNGIIDQMLKETRLSEADDFSPIEAEGMSLFMERDHSTPSIMTPQRLSGLQKVYLADGT